MPKGYDVVGLYCIQQDNLAKLAPEMYKTSPYFNDAEMEWQWLDVCKSFASHCRQQVINSVFYGPDTVPDAQPSVRTLKVILHDTVRHLYFVCVKFSQWWHIKGKGFPYSLPSVGPGADPGVQAVSPQVTVRHPPDGWLPSLSARPVFT